MGVFPSQSVLLWTMWSVMEFLTGNHPVPSVFINSIFVVHHAYLLNSCVLQSTTQRRRYHQHRCNCKFSRNTHGHIIIWNNTCPLTEQFMCHLGVFRWLPWRHLRNLPYWPGGWNRAAIGRDDQTLSGWGHCSLQTRRTALCHRKHNKVQASISHIVAQSQLAFWFTICSFWMVVSKIAQESGFEVSPYFIGHGIGTHFHCHPEIWHHGEFSYKVLLTYWDNGLLS